jgi:hypothetical protein
MAVASRRWAWCDISPVLPISPQENNEKWWALSLQTWGKNEFLVRKCLILAWVVGRLARGHRGVFGHILGTKVLSNIAIISIISLKMAPRSDSCRRENGL